MTTIICQYSYDFMHTDCNNIYLRLFVSLNNFISRDRQKLNDLRRHMDPRVSVDLSIFITHLTQECNGRNSHHPERWSVIELDKVPSDQVW